MKQKIVYRILQSVLVLAMIAGITILIVPGAVKFKNELARKQTAQVFYKTAEERTQEEREAETALCEAYNALLLEKQQSFDPLTDTSLLDSYEERLSVSDTMAVLEIPVLGLTIPVCHGTSEESLRKGAGHLMESSLPVGGSGTHSVLAAHNGDSRAVSFSELNRLVIGDLFFVSAGDETLAYSVDQISVVTPDETEQTKIVPGEDYVTLVTCTPKNVNSHRLLVRGTRVMMPESVPDREISKIEKVLFTGIFAELVLMGILLFIVRLNKNKKRYMTYKPKN